MEELKKENDILKIERAELLAKHADLLAKNTRLKSSGKSDTSSGFVTELIDVTSMVQNGTLPPALQYLDPDRYSQTPQKQDILLSEPSGTPPWTGCVTIHHKKENPIFR